MNSIVTCVALVAVMGVSAGAARAADGVLIVQKTTADGGAPQTHQVQIDGRRMRTEAAGSRGEKQVLVFDGGRQVMMIIDEATKTYVEMTKADAEAMGGEMQGMMAQMQQMMKDMPPEQRAQMEAAMKGRGMGAATAAPPKIAYKKVGTGTVGKWACDKYEGYAGAEKVSEVCTVDPKALGFTAADFAVSREMAEFFKKFMPAGGADMFAVGSADSQGFSGVPVRTVSSAGGRQVTTEMTEVSRQTFADSVFQAPAGYKKTSMGGRR